MSLIFHEKSFVYLDIIIQVNNYSMKPLEEYMLFTKTGAENITVINSQGVRSRQCSMEFDVTQKYVPEPSLNFSVVVIISSFSSRFSFVYIIIIFHVYQINISSWWLFSFCYTIVSLYKNYQTFAIAAVLIKYLQGSDKTWVENEPERIPFKSQYVGSSQKEEKTQVVFITLTTLFVVIVVGCIIEVYRTNRAHKKRIERETDESIIWSKEQATKLHEPGSGGIVGGGSGAVGGKAFGYKPVSLCLFYYILFYKSCNMLR